MWFLLHMGADALVTAKGGRTPLDVALENSYTQLIPLYQQMQVSGWLRDAVNFTASIQNGSEITWPNVEFLSGELQQQLVVQPNT